MAQVFPLLENRKEITDRWELGLKTRAKGLWIQPVFERSALPVWTINSVTIKPQPQALSFCPQKQRGLLVVHLHGQVYSPLHASLTLSLTNSSKQQPVIKYFLVLFIFFKGAWRKEKGIAHLLGSNPVAVKFKEERRSYSMFLKAEVTAIDTFSNKLKKKNLF